jgi:hypothetical protein
LASFSTVCSVGFLLHARLETATLDHEVLDHAVEDRVRVVTLVHVIQEVGNGLRCLVGVQFDLDVALVGGHEYGGHVFILWLAL